MMKFKSLFKFSTVSSLKSMMLFIGIFLVSSILINVTSAMSNSVGGTSMEVASIVYLLIYGLAMGRENLSFGLVNSVSRKSIVAATMASLCVLSIIVTAVSTLINMLLSTIFHSSVPIYSLVFSGMSWMGGSKIVTMSSGDYIMSFAWFTMIAIFISFVGLLLSTIVYRTRLTQRIIIFGLTPIVLFYLLPAIDKALFNSAIGNVIFKGAKLLAGIVGNNAPNPAISIAVIGGIAVIVAAANFLIFRRIKLQAKVA